MKRQKMMMEVLAAVLILLGVGLLFLRNNSLEAEDDIVESQTISLNQLTRDDIIALSYEYGGETLSFELEEGTWYLASDHSVNLTQSYISNMASFFAGMLMESEIDNVTDFEQYGLGDTAKTLTVTTNTGTLVYKLGDENPLSGEYYMAIPGEDKVYTVDSYYENRFEYALEDMVIVEEEEETETAEFDLEEKSETGETSQE